MIILTVKHALENGFFIIGHRIFRQVQGALIGFPISSVLCVLTIMRIERRMIPQRELSLTARRWVGVRYVDNLLTVNVRHDVHGDVLPKWLENPLCYGHPIMLEFESAWDYLGLAFLVREGSIGLQYTVHGIDEATADPYHVSTLCEHRWRYRDPQAASSKRHRLSGMESRLHAVAKHAFPRRLAKRGVLELLIVAIAMNYAIPDLALLYRKIAKRYPFVFGHRFDSGVKSALSRNKAQAGFQLRSLLNCYFF